MSYHRANVHTQALPRQAHGVRHQLRATARTEEKDSLSIPGTPDPFETYNATTDQIPISNIPLIFTNSHASPSVLIPARGQIGRQPDNRRVKTVSLFDALGLDQKSEQSTTCPDSESTSQDGTIQRK